MALKIYFNRKRHDLLSWRLMVNQLFGISPQDRLIEMNLAYLYDGRKKKKINWCL